MLEVSNVGTGEDIRTMTIDSGAAETVCGPEHVPGCSVIRPRGPQRDAKYILPNGEVVINEGEKKVKVRTMEGNKWPSG